MASREKTIRATAAGYDARLRMTVVMVDSRREFAPCHPSVRIQSAGAAAWCGQCGSSVDPFESRPVARLVPLTVPAGESA